MNGNGNGKLATWVAATLITAVLIPLGFRVGTQTAANTADLRALDARSREADTEVKRRLDNIERKLDRLLER